MLDATGAPGEVEQAVPDVGRTVAPKALVRRFSSGTSMRLS